MLTQAEIFADIKRRRYEETENGWTTAEYAEQLGVSRPTARRHVLEGIRAGTIKLVGRRRFNYSERSACWLPVYLFVTDASKAIKADNRKEAGAAPVARLVPSRRDRRNR